MEENPAATLHCPNTRCQAPNPQSNKFCQKCRTPLLRRYLWAIGQGLEAYKPGEVIGDRYELINQRILLDTKPGMPPETPPDIPKGLEPYLKLSPYRLHVPQVYGRLTLDGGSRPSEIWLLEEAPIQETKAGDARGQLLPELTAAWKDAPALRQLNWLWQLASLWQPLSSEGAASSLFSPALVRVEGSIVRLLELQPDTKGTPTLQQLGSLWSKLLTEASPTIAGFFQQLCTQLVEGQIRSSEQLVALLDRALFDCGRSRSRTYQIFTRSDAGPTRNHNEDACYPQSSQLKKTPSSASALAMVCDGIGGHEGGEVASHLAIDTLRERLEKLSPTPEPYDPTALTLELESAVCAANDIISQRNDSERRSDRQRMGTTLVMAQTFVHEIYITHVGDSRVYWITKNGCHQVTQDDDLATREVRLGYALYRNAVQQPTSGSLVQALGMAPSATLHPTVQRFVLDEDCIFLLCSDGLSDNDRVEQYWQTEILPILEGQVDLTTAGARLIEIANTQNGHDNATVALVHCRVTSTNQKGETQLQPRQLESPPPLDATRRQTLVTATPSEMKTQQLPTTKSSSPWRTLGLLLGIFILLGLGGVVAYLLVPSFSRKIDLLAGLEPSPTPAQQQTASPSPTAASPEPSAPAIATLEEGEVIQVASSAIANAEGKDIPLSLQRGISPPQNQSRLGIIPTDSILQVLGKSTDEQQTSWLQLKVCSSGTNTSPPSRPSPANPSPATTPTPETSPTASNSPARSVGYRQVQPGENGWIKEADLLPLVNPNFTPTATQQSQCTSATPSPPSTPTPKPTPSP